MTLILLGIDCAGRQPTAALFEFLRRNQVTCVQVISGPQPDPISATGVADLVRLTLREPAPKDDWDRSYPPPKGRLKAWQV